MKSMFFLALTLVLFVDAVQYDENNKEESFDSRHEETRKRLEDVRKIIKAENRLKDKDIDYDMSMIDDHLEKMKSLPRENLQFDDKNYTDYRQDRSEYEKMNSGTVLEISNISFYAVISILVSLNFF